MSTAHIMLWFLAVTCLFETVMSVSQVFQPLPPLVLCCVLFSHLVKGTVVSHLYSVIVLLDRALP